MAISLKATGTWATYTADGTVAIPGTPASGDRMFLFVVWKDFAITVTDPSGWTPIGTEFADGTTVTGGGTGSMKVMAWYRDWVSGDTNPTLAFSTAVGLIGAAVIQLWTKGGGDSWGTPLNSTAAWTSNTPATPQTISASSTTAVPDNSVVMALFGIRDDCEITQPTDSIDVSSGVTWNGSTVESPLSQYNILTGDDLTGDLCHRFVTTGGTVTLRVTATLDTSETGAIKWVTQGITASTGGSSARFNVISGESSGIYHKIIGAP